MLLYRWLLVICLACFLALCYYGYSSLFPPDSDLISNSELRGKWYFKKASPPCRDNYMEFLNDSDMVRADGTILVRNKFRLQNLKPGYAIVKENFQISGDKNCNGVPLSSIPEMHYKIGRWILWKKGNKLRFYIRKDRSGKFIELQKDS